MRLLRGSTIRAWLPVLVLISIPATFAAAALVAWGAARVLAVFGLAWVVYLLIPLLGVAAIAGWLFCVAWLSRVASSGGQK